MCMSEGEGASVFVCVVIAIWYFALIIGLIALPFGGHRYDILSKRYLYFYRFKIPT